MSFAYPTVTIGTSTYTVYADVATCDAYMEGSMSENAVAWRALTEADDKGRYLVQMTRTLDRQQWKGEKTDPTNEHDWPRMNTGVPGVVDDAVPQDIIDACCEGAAALSNGANFETTLSQTSMIQSMSAGSVSISYFYPNVSTVIGGARFPVNIQELLWPYLGFGTGAAGTQIGAAQSFGTDGKSATDADFGLNRAL